jgi:hypothetical protein
LQIAARIGQSRLAVGETTTLEVTVEGALGGEEPQVQMPPGIELLGRGREQSVSWINGKLSQRTLFSLRDFARGGRTLHDRSDRRHGLGPDVSQRRRRARGQRGPGAGTNERRRTRDADG